MKVFLSWSGPRSKAVAQALADWLPRIVQAVQPWFSPDIEKGARSREAIAAALVDAKVGIVCLTPENLDSKWINFEAGALSKTPDARLCTLLLQLTPAGVEAPLDSFQHTRAEKDDVLRLVSGLASDSAKYGGPPIKEAHLESSFALMWPELEGQICAAMSLAIRAPPPPRKTDDKIDEILEKVRALESRMETQEGSLVPGLVDIVSSAHGLGGKRMSDRGKKEFAALIWRKVSRKFEDAAIPGETESLRDSFPQSDGGPD